MAEIAEPVRYPVRLEVERSPNQSRWKAALRLPLSLPVLVFSTFLHGGLVFAVWSAVVVTGRIPAWLFDFQVAANRWVVRSVGYALILTDEYPRFEGEHPIRYEVDDPGMLSRWRVGFWKLVTAVPHFFLLGLMGLSLLVAVPLSWIAVVVTGRYPVRLNDYVSGVLRWAARVQAYVLSLTDELPPFSLSDEPDPRWPYTRGIAPAIGLTAVVSVIAFNSALLILRPGHLSAEVSYERLVAGDLSPGEALVQVDAGQDDFDYDQTGTVELDAATDPADQLLPLVDPQAGHRLVEFELTIENQTWEFLELTESDFQLTDQHGRTHQPLLILVDGRPPIVGLDYGETASTILFFEIPDVATPTALRFRMDHHVHRNLTYTFD